MTLDDLELENNLFSSFRRQYLENSMHCCRALTFASARLSCNIKTYVNIQIFLLCMLKATCLVYQTTIGNNIHRL